LIGPHTGFLPDPDRARAVDEAVHLALADSLDHVAGACRAAPAAVGVADTLDGPVAAIRAGGRVPPQGFGLYYELVEQLVADRIEAAHRTALQLAAVGQRPAGLALHRRGAARELDRVFDLRMGPGAARFHPIPLKMQDDFPPLLDAGLDLLDRGAPALAGENRAILSDIVLAQAPPGAAREFDGASHYQFWGLLLLNPRHHRTPLAVAEVLAHEAGHSLLFGLTRDEPLVHNHDSALYPSPLRVDPRPMDGIYHATFVSARMAWAMEVLADSGVLTAAEQAQARIEAAKDRANFAMGLSVVQAEGDLSATGAQIMDGAIRAMRDGWT